MTKTRTGCPRCGRKSFGRTCGEYPHCKPTETDAEFEARSLCSERADLGLQGIHRPVALLLDSVQDDGRFTLRVRCRLCKRLGHVDLDLSHDEAGVTWEKGQP